MSLKRQLLDRISATGSLSFADFMAAALYDPFHGYYASGKARIGRSGDFYTAVSSGPLFGRLLARQFIQMWELLNRPAQWTLVEQGAFDGRLSADILEALRDFSPECLAATILRIVEPFSLFQSRQAATLRPFSSQVIWHRDVNALPLFCGVHFSNELLDAFPVHRVRRGPEGWEEMRVTSKEGSLQWQSAPINDGALKAAVTEIQVPEEPFLTEINLTHRPWLEALANRLQRGWILTFDYGMSSPELTAAHRKEGTAAAYRAHQRALDLLAEPGDQDLTAHVNFTAVVRTALKLGLSLATFTDQHRFFTGLAPLHFEDATAPISPAQQHELLAFRTLSHPQLMGFQFKVLCLSKEVDRKISGAQYARNPAEALGV